MKPARISVVVTAYNHEEYVAQCLDGILMQKGTFELEVILGDDCSTDRTCQIMQEYVERYPGTFLLLPPIANMGVTKNIKRCLDACSGDYIAFCEGDDYWTDSYKLQKQMEFLANHPDYSLCFNAIMVYYENRRKCVPHSEQLVLNKHTLTIEDLIAANYIGNFSCCMYRTETIQKLPDELFNIRVWDWMFNMACSRLGEIGFIRDWMSVYRIHPKGVYSGKSQSEKDRDLCQSIDVYDRFFNYEYHKQFSRLKNRIATQYGNDSGHRVPFVKKYGGLLIRAIRHPRQARDRLVSALSVGIAELTGAAVSAAAQAKDAQIDRLTSAVQTSDAQVAELSSELHTKDVRIAQLTSTIFANIEVAQELPKKVLSKKLHVGCGSVKITGWLSIDVEPGADLVIDVRQGLPFEENSIDFIYNEHFIEHLTYEEGETVLREFWRCLKKGGVLRIATPDLDSIVMRYNRDFNSSEWFPSGFEFVKTKGMAINMSFRWWAHKFIYNEEELRNQLKKAGFSNLTRCELNRSSHPELSNLETRKESRLIVEAIK